MAKQKNNHTKLYGICESKCKVEVVSKEQHDQTVTELNSNVSSLQQGVTDLNSNVSGLQQGVTDLTSNVATIQQEVLSLKNSTNVYFCTTDANVRFKNVEIENFDLSTIKEGTCIKVCFVNGNSSESPKLEINGNEEFDDTDIDIVVDDVFKVGQTKWLDKPYGDIENGAYIWDSGTILELKYNGEKWVVLNNPIVHREITKSQNAFSYVIRIDGLKEITLQRFSEFVKLESGSMKTLYFDTKIPMSKQWTQCLSISSECEEISVSTFYSVPTTTSSPNNFKVQLINVSSSKFENYTYGNLYYKGY